MKRCCHVDAAGAKITIIHKIEPPDYCFSHTLSKWLKAQIENEKIDSHFPRVLVCGWGNETLTDLQITSLNDVEVLFHYSRSHVKQSDTHVENKDHSWSRRVLSAVKRLVPEIDSCQECLCGAGGSYRDAESYQWVNCPVSPCMLLIDRSISSSSSLQLRESGLNVWKGSGKSMHTPASTQRFLYIFKGRHSCSDV